MAFSKDFEIEFDSTYRTNNSISSTDYEFMLPYSFPTVSGQTSLTLGDVIIPQAFYNIPLTTISSGANFFTIPSGRYDASSLCSAIQTGMQATAGAGTGLGFSTATCSFINTINKIRFNDGSGGKTIVNSTGNDLFTWMGFSGTSLTFGTAGSALTAPSLPSLNLDREQRVYIRIYAVDNKIMLPQLNTQIFTFGVSLKQVNSSGYFHYTPLEHLPQKLYLNPNQLRSNSYLKVLLVWGDGTPIDLNGRNWKFVLKVE